MSSYKVTYFNGRGRAEASRLVLALAGQEFQDVRVTSDEWKELKPQTKFGQLPMLEVDGKSYTQSRAIMNYLGRKFGFYPNDVEDAFKVDEIIFIMEDYFSQAIKAHFAKEEEKEEKQKEYKENQVPKFNGFLEKLLKENNGGSGFFVGTKVTVADVAVFDFLSNDKDALKNYPALLAHVERIGNMDKIKAWVDKRPKTMF